MQQESILSAISEKKTLNLTTVIEEMPADIETPVSAFLKLRDLGARFLLESVESGTVLGRYSFIGIKPETKIIMDKENVVLRNSTQSLSLPHVDRGAPLSSIPDTSADSLNLPIALLYLTDTLLVFDHVQRKLQIMCLALNSSEKEAKEKLCRIRELLSLPLDFHPHRNIATKEEMLTSNFTEDRFCQTVFRVKEHIKAGDVYQLVLSQRLGGETEVDPFMIYRALRMLNPSPYMFFLDFDETKLIGSSPEALVRLENGWATLRPIAGTRPRGEDERKDAQLSRQLLDDEKERAEHVMLVDLGRNDLGRCCDFGTVKVTEFMKVERYSHVMHLTSNVVGKLKSGLDQFDLLRATFPAGTVTGAPKIRAMEIIEGLENLKRGPYAGAVGYFSLTGDMDWCITIRTIIMKGKKYFLQAGAGIVADSVPEKEYQETNNKIAALRKAIQIAEEGF
jgi:anthranilate synthase component 1